MLRLVGRQCRQAGCRRLVATTSAHRCLRRLSTLSSPRFALICSALLTTRSRAAQKAIGDIIPTPPPITHQHRDIYLHPASPDKETGSD